MKLFGIKSKELGKIILNSSQIAFNLAQKPNDGFTVFENESDAIQWIQNDNKTENSPSEGQPSTGYDNDKILITFNSDENKRPTSDNDEYVPAKRIKLDDELPPLRHHIKIEPPSPNHDSDICK